MKKEDLSLLKYYKEGGQLCGFEGSTVWKGLVFAGYLDGDLELTLKGRQFINSYENWDSVTAYVNPIKITIGPK